MKHWKFLSLALCLACASMAAATAPKADRDFEFEQERMRLTSEAVFVISCFDDQDHVTAYSHHGIRLWSAPFHAKILSWEIHADRIFVFSKDRSGYKTYLTCLDRYTGTLLWQRP